MRLELATDQSSLIATENANSMFHKLLLLLFPLLPILPPKRDASLLGLLLLFCFFLFCRFLAFLLLLFLRLLCWRSSISIVVIIQRNSILQSGSWVCFFAQTWSCPALANIMWSASNVTGPIILVARTHLPIMLNQNIATFLVSLNGLLRNRHLLMQRESRKKIVTASWFRCVSVDCHEPFCRKCAC